MPKSQPGGMTHMLADLCKKFDISNIDMIELDYSRTY